MTIYILHTKLIVVLMLILAGIPVQAQKKRSRSQMKTDTLAVLREFVHLSNNYQQAPLYLELDLNNSTNFITGEEDTTHTSVLFYIMPGTSYMRFGDAEQLVNDSLALLVNDKIQRMILFTNAQPVLQRMKAMAGGQWQQDSSLLQLAEKFSAQRLAQQQNKGIILLTARRLLHGTTLPGETIEFQYDAATKGPVQVITTKRSLFPVTEEVYKALSSRPEMEGKLITLQENKYYVVKEQQAGFVYKKIAHDLNMQLPAIITDRLIRNEEGGFKPVSAYQQYAVTIN